jgi:hypothetical protein
MKPSKFTILRGARRGNSWVACPERLPLGSEDLYLFAGSAFSKGV